MSKRRTTRISLYNSSKLKPRAHENKTCSVNPYHPSHDASAYTFSLHIGDELCMLLLHIKDQHDAHQTYQLHL